MSEQEEAYRKYGIVEDEDDKRQQALSRVRERLEAIPSLEMRVQLLYEQVVAIMESHNKLAETVQKHHEAIGSNIDMINDHHSVLLAFKEYIFGDQPNA